MDKILNITAQTQEEFSLQFEKYLQQKPNNTTKGIIYFWELENEIPRKKGKSRIIYIGQTSKTLQGRYNPSTAFKIEVDYFEQHYKELIKHYGPLSIRIEQVENPEIAEWNAYQQFKNMHLESPPLNLKSPTKQKS